MNQTPRSSLPDPAHYSQPGPYVHVVDASGHTVAVPARNLGAQRYNTFAIVSFILALVGGSLLAVIFGHLAKAQIRETGEGGEGFATAGLIIGYITLLPILFILLIIAF